jgi:hypothetical protein
MWQEGKERGRGKRGEREGKEIGGVGGRGGERETDRINHKSLGVLGRFTSSEECARPWYMPSPPSTCPISLIANLNKILSTPSPNGLNHSSLLSFSPLFLDPRPCPSQSLQELSDFAYTNRVIFFNEEDKKSVSRLEGNLEVWMAPMMNTW